MSELGSPMSATLHGWGEIAKHLRVSPKTAQRYAREKRLPIARPAGPNAMVLAKIEDLDKWLLGQRFECETDRGPATGPRLEISPTTTVGLPGNKAGLWHLGICVLLYASLYVIALFLEVSYRFYQFEDLVKSRSVFAFLWISATSVLALTVDWTLTTRDRKHGFVLAFGVALASALLLCWSLQNVLPSFPVTGHRLQAQTAQVAYLKNVFLYFFPLAVVLWLIPFHFVAAIRRELDRGNHRLVLEMLTGKPESVRPTNAPYLRVWWLSAGLFGAALVSLIMTNRLFDHLTEGPYMGLFMKLVLARVFVYFSLGLACLLWYHRALNELKRESMASKPLTLSRS